MHGDVGGVGKWVGHESWNKDKCRSVEDGADGRVAKWSSSVCVEGEVARGNLEDGWIVARGVEVKAGRNGQ